MQETTSLFQLPFSSHILVSSIIYFFLICIIAVSILFAISTLAWTPSRLGNRHMPDNLAFLKDSI